MAGLSVGFNMKIIKINFAFFNPGKGVLKIHFSCPYGFDLAAVQGNAAFPFIGKEKITECLFIRCD